MEALREIPPINDVIRAPRLSGYRKILESPWGTRVLHDVFAATRRRLVASQSVVVRAELLSQIVADVARGIEDLLRPSLRQVINASGVVLHTNLGRAPLSASAIDHLREVSIGYSNLEFELDSGARGKRDMHVERLLCPLLGCESAIVVNNNAAAVLLVLHALGEGGEVIASRGEEVEIGGAFRVPEVMEKSGARLREVGTTNRTRIADYENAIGENTRLLLRVHPSNFRMIGFTERPSLEEFAALGRKRNVPTFEDLGSGCIFDVAPMGISHEPSAVESVRAGVDVVSFSGDKLLGGPQAGIIAGKRTFVERIRRNALFRALRVDKLTLAALEYVLISHLRGDLDEIPIWRMLRTPAEDLRKRAEQFAAKIGPAAKAVQLLSVVGAGSAPEAQLPSWGFALNLPKTSESELERQLRLSTPPVIVRVEEGQVIFDLRTVDPAQDDVLMDVFAKLTGWTGRAGS